MRFGLRMGPDGFVNLREMLSIDHGRFFAGFTERDVVRVVRSNDKKRFSLSEDGRAEYLVRANQGHTMGAVEDESLLVDVCQGELEHRGEVCGQWSATIYTSLPEHPTEMKRSSVACGPIARS